MKLAKNKNNVLTKNKKSAIITRSAHQNGVLATFQGDIMQYMQDSVLIPAIFEGVSRVRSVFTLVGKRTPKDPIGNNMSVVENVVREGLRLVGVSERSLDQEVAKEVQRAHLRRDDLISYVGLTWLPYVMANPKPVAGADHVDVSGKSILDLQLGSATRICADVAHLIVPGYGSLIAPADCPVIDIVDPNTGGQVVQCHAGWQGILAGAVTKTMTRMIRRGLNPACVLANVHPNATDGFELQGEGLERWQATFGGDFIDVVDGRSYISMTGAVVAQMEEAGVKSDRIQTSSQYSSGGKDLNSLTDDRFYSHRAKAQKGFNGRNAAVLVRVDY